jgi:hypothetical protein
MIPQWRKGRKGFSLRSLWLSGENDTAKAQRTQRFFLRSLWLSGENDTAKAQRTLSYKLLTIPLSILKPNPFSVIC